MATPPTFSVGATLTAAQMNQIGMWKTGSVTLTGQTTAQLNNCFTSDFDKYKVIYNIRSGSGSASLYTRLSVGGVPNSTAGSYIYGGRYVGFPTVGAADFNGADPQFGFSFFSTSPTAAEIVLTNPYSAIPTPMSGTFMNVNAGCFVGGYHNQSTAYDGLYIYNSSSLAMYGSVTILGIRN
jgi:hypothetical protein